MKRRLFAVFSSLCLVAFAIYVYADEKPKQVRAKDAPTVWLTRQVAISTRVVDAIGRKQKSRFDCCASPALYRGRRDHSEGIQLAEVVVSGKELDDNSAFRCTTIHTVIMSVDANDHVVVDQDSLKLQQGDCVQWQIKDDLKDAMTIVGIDFVDTRLEAGESQKVGIPFEVTDLCIDAGNACLAYIALGAAKDWARYPYVAVVNYQGKLKYSDPELMVSCSGCMGPDPR